MKKLRNVSRETSELLGELGGKRKEVCFMSTSRNQEVDIIIIHYGDLSVGALSIIQFVCVCVAGGRGKHIIIHSGFIWMEKHHKRKRTQSETNEQCRKPKSGSEK